jgi:hypothetical protein
MMPDTKELLERALETATAASPSPDDFDRFVRYRERRRRSQRIAAGAVGLAVAVALIVGGIAVLRSSGGTRPGGQEREPTLPAPPRGEAIAGVTERGIPFLAVRHDDGTLTAFEAVSTHLGRGNVRRLLGWCASSRTFDDPFHGSRFDEFGHYLMGPAPTGLVRLRVETVTENPLTFRLGEPRPAIPRDEPAVHVDGPFCTDLEKTPLLSPVVASGGVTPAELAASEPPIRGTRWAVEGTLVLSPDGEARLCASYVDGICESGAPVQGLTPWDANELVVEGTWFVLVRDGYLDDPIRVWAAG